MTVIASDIALQLLQIKAIKLNPQKPFTWASGLKSPIYCDNRLTLSFPVVRRAIRDGLANLTREFGIVETVAGVATAGIPHGTLLADKMDLPFIYVRSKKKSHGKQNLIEGSYDKGTRAIVVEDLISTGKSSIAAVKALEEAGIEVEALISIFTYNLGISRKNLKDANVNHDSLTNYETLIEIAAKEGFINSSDLKSLEEWRENPQKWSEEHS